KQFLGKPLLRALGLCLQTCCFLKRGSNPHCIVASDFNNDGIADLTNANLYSNSVSVLLGNRDGTFQSPIAYSTGTLTQGVAVGDFNGDGRPDVVVANRGLK
ncbi:MAG: VCBS repeat-containing protein, partial [Candidatus Midichloria sp.]|nr:VCBS repeat-containing protein [Candidatus Midichloria sp.]